MSFAYELGKIDIAGMVKASGRLGDMAGTYLKYSPVGPIAGAAGRYVDKVTAPDPNFMGPPAPATAGHVLGSAAGGVFGPGYVSKALASKGVNAVRGVWNGTVRPHVKQLGADFSAGAMGNSDVQTGLASVNKIGDAAGALAGGSRGAMGWLGKYWPLLLGGAALGGGAMLMGGRRKRPEDAYSDYRPM